MSKKPTPPVPDAPAPLPLPSAGGAFVVEDGKLIRVSTPVEAPIEQDPKAEA